MILDDALNVNNLPWGDRLQRCKGVGLLWNVKRIDLATNYVSIVE